MGHHGDTNLYAVWELHCLGYLLLFWCVLNNEDNSRIFSLLRAWKSKMWNYTSSPSSTLFAILEQYKQAWNLSVDRRQFPNFQGRLILTSSCCHACSLISQYRNWKLHNQAMTVLGCSNLADGSSSAASSWCSLEMLFDCFKLFGSWQETNMRIKLFSSPPHTPLCVIAKLKLNASENLQEEFGV